MQKRPSEVQGSRLVAFNGDGSANVDERMARPAQASAAQMASRKIKSIRGMKRAISPNKLSPIRNQENLPKQSAPSPFASLPVGPSGTANPPSSSFIFSAPPVSSNPFGPSSPSKLNDGGFKGSIFSIPNGNSGAVTEAANESDISMVTASPLRPGLSPAAPAWPQPAIGSSPAKVPDLFNGIKGFGPTPPAPASADVAASTPGALQTPVGPILNFAPKFDVARAFGAPATPVPAPATGAIASTPQATSALTNGTPGPHAALQPNGVASPSIPPMNGMAKTNTPLFSAPVVSSPSLTPAAIPAATPGPVAATTPRSIFGTKPAAGETTPKNPFASLATAPTPVPPQPKTAAPTPSFAFSPAPAALAGKAPIAEPSPAATPLPSKASLGEVTEPAAPVSTATASSASRDPSRSLPPMPAPSHFNEAQRQQYEVAYRLISLNESFKAEVLGASPAVDLSALFEPYRKLRADIIASLEAPVATKSPERATAEKRKPTDDGRNDSPTKKSATSGVFRSILDKPSGQTGSPMSGNIFGHLANQPNAEPDEADDDEPAVPVQSATPLAPAASVGSGKSLFDRISVPNPSVPPTPTPPTPSANTQTPMAKTPIFSFSSSGLAPTTTPSTTLGMAPATPKGTLTEESASDEDEDKNKPPQIDLVSEAGPGEENETVLYQIRAKAMMFKSDIKAWSNQGVGPLRVLKDRDTGKVRILMRHDPRGSIILNTAVFKHGKYSLTGPGTVQMVVPGEDGKLKTWIVKVKEAEVAEKLKKVLQDSAAEL